MTNNYPTGVVTISNDDKQLHIVGSMDIKLLKKAIKPFIKGVKLVEFATYPHNDGGNAILMRDSCSRDKNTWVAVCPVIEEFEE